MALLVIGTSPTEGKVLVRDTVTGAISWEVGAPKQIASMTEKINRAGDFGTVDYETYVPPGGAEPSQTMTDEYGTWTINPNTGQYELTTPIAPGIVTPGVGAPTTYQPYQPTGTVLTEVSPRPGGPGESPYAPGSPEWMGEEYTPWAGYGTAMGLFGRTALSPYEESLKARHPFLESLYNILGNLTGAGGEGQYAPGRYAQWAPGFAKNPFAMYGQAQDIMGAMPGMGEKQLGEMAYGGGGLADLLYMAMRPIIGKQAAANLASKTMPAMKEQWMGQYPGWQAGGGQPSFADYIRQELNLGQWF